MEHKERKKHTILNHWGEQKPVQADLDKLYIEVEVAELSDVEIVKVKKKVETGGAWIDEVKISPIYHYNLVQLINNKTSVLVGLLKWKDQRPSQGLIAYKKIIDALS